MAVANCPSCGGAVEFSIGSTAVVVCNYCRSLVARTDVGVEDLGKVAAIIDTGSPLRRDLFGKYQGTGFRIVGRTQMRHEAGGYWDEWYAHFDDGRWGWLAEAQGRFYMTFDTEGSAPPLDQLQVGARVPQVDNMVVAEIGQGTLASAEGELPWKPQPGTSYDFADLSGADLAFATIDYSEDEPLVFKGYQVTLPDIGINIAGEAAQQRKVKVERLNCSNCGAALDLVAPDQSERVVCPSCGAAHDVSEGTLRFLEVLKQKPFAVRVPLGSKGTIDGVQYVVAGAMERSVTFDEKYFWTEYLIFNLEKGFRWLVESDGHWSFVTPINAGDVQDTESSAGAARFVTFQGKSYKLFQDAIAHVEAVVGEFYWKVSQGEKVRAIDYIAPPEGISKEISGTAHGREVNYSYARYMKPSEVEAAFGIKGLPSPQGINPMQPNPVGRVGRTWLALMAVLVVVAAIVAFHSPNREVLKQHIDLSAPQTWDPNNPAPQPQPQQPAPQPLIPKQEESRVVFTQPFKLSGNRNLLVEAKSDVNNNWAYVGADIINEQTGMLESFDLPIEYYHGNDGGESWSEGSNAKRVYLSSMPAGTYSMRMEVQYDGTNPNLPTVDVVIREGVFHWTHFVIALVLVTIPAFLVVVRRRAFEGRRWADSSTTPQEG